MSGDPEIFKTPASEEASFVQVVGTLTEVLAARKRSIVNADEEVVVRTMPSEEDLAEMSDFGRQYILNAIKIGTEKKVGKDRLIAAMKLADILHDSPIKDDIVTISRIPKKVIEYPNSFMESELTPADWDDVARLRGAANRIGVYMEEHGYFFRLNPGGLVLMGRIVEKVHFGDQDEEGVLVIDPNIYYVSSPLSEYFYGTPEITHSVETMGMHLATGETLVFTHPIVIDLKGREQSRRELQETITHEWDHWLYGNFQASQPIKDTPILWHMEATAYCAQLLSAISDEEFYQRFTSLMELAKKIVPKGSDGQPIYDYLEEHGKAKVGILDALGRMRGDQHLFLGFITAGEDVGVTTYLQNHGVNSIPDLIASITQIRNSIYHYYFDIDQVPQPNIMI